jgi:hypothetical protein
MSCLLPPRASGTDNSDVSNRGDMMQYINGTARVIVVYLVCMLVGQMIAVGIGLVIDPYSKTIALATFIPLYYLMFWAAWRIALFIADRTPEPAAQPVSGTKIGAWLFAPAILALDIAD